MRVKHYSIPKPDSDLPPSDTSAKLRTITRLLWGLMVLAITVCLLLGLQMMTGNGKSPPVDEAGNTLSSGRAAASETNGAEGPWGRLRYVPISIAPPLSSISLATPMESQQVEWHFPGTILARLPALLDEIGLSETTCQQIIPLAEINPGIEGLTIRPPSELVLGLSKEDRAALYLYLGAIEENEDQRMSFRYCGDSLDEWIGGTPLKPQTRSLVESLTYRNGSFLFFSDLRSIEQSLASPEERLQLVKALARETTFLVYLESTSKSDLEDLVNYWGRDGRARDVRPILGSLVAGGEGSSVDITYLLPPFARGRIYTYPIVPVFGLEEKQDCHWSAMNFFAEEPNDRYCDVQKVVLDLAQEYYPVHGDLRFGDVVTFIDVKEVLYHSAVYIADGLLFTKNGASPAHPWMFMKLEDMEYYYPVLKKAKIRYFRRRDL